MRASIKSGGPGKPMTVPAPGAVSAVGPSKAAPKPRIKNTRDYGKPMAPGPSPDPFGPADSTGRLGGI